MLYLEASALLLLVALASADCSWVYADHPSGTAFTGGRPIDVCAGVHRNQQTRCSLRASTLRIVNWAAESRTWGTIIGVLGYSTYNKNKAISSTAKKSLSLAKDQFASRGASVIVVSGGNVHPVNTPYNEAYEMRRYLINKLGVDRDVVAIDPYARHSYTNVRNIGRYALTNGAYRVVLVTRRGADFGSWNSRPKKNLGYSLGTFESTSSGDVAIYYPSKSVFRVGPDPLDP
eukprot:m51a1_g13971 hypothetical protein (232) ;mRNA; r:989177-989872